MGRGGIPAANMFWSVLGGKENMELKGWGGWGRSGWRGGIPVANTFWSVLGGKENMELKGWGGWGRSGWVGGYTCC